VSAQGGVEGTSDLSHRISRAASSLTTASRLRFARPNSSRRKRKAAAADRRAADRWTTTAVADDPTVMATTHVVCSSPSALSQSASL
jgi:putative hemolysin